MLLLQCDRVKKHKQHNKKKIKKNSISVIYVFVNAQKVVRPRGLPHMSFVISAVTTTQCSMKKLEKLELTQSHQHSAMGQNLPCGPFGP